MLNKAMVEKIRDRKIEAAREMVESLRKEAPALNEQRFVSRHVVELLRESGLLHLLKPARFGGEPVGLKCAALVGRELARGDASAAWVHGVYYGHEHIVGLFPEQVQHEYWTGSDFTLSASSFIPSGKAVAVPGGFELSGKWSFCSGVDNVNWTFVGAIVGMTTGDPALPDSRLFMVPASDYVIVDDWHVMGLRATGSKSIVLDKVFVPNIRVIREGVLHEIRIR